MILIICITIIIISVGLICVSVGSYKASKEIYGRLEKLDSFVEVLVRSVNRIERERRLEELQIILDKEGLGYCVSYDRLVSYELGDLSYESDKDSKESKQRIADYISGKNSGKYLLSDSCSETGACYPTSLSDHLAGQESKKKQKRSKK